MMEIKNVKALTKKEIIAEVTALTKVGFFDTWEFERTDPDRIMAVLFPTERRGGLMMELDSKNSKYRVLHLGAIGTLTSDAWSNWSYIINELAM